MSDRKLTEVKLFFDDSDQQNLGYAYRAYYSDGHQDSGPYDDIASPITPACLLFHCESLAGNLGGNLLGEANHCKKTNTTTWSEQQCSLGKLTQH